MLQALLWGAPVSVYWLMEPETERRCLLLLYILHMEALRKQRDQLAVGGLSPYRGNGVTNYLLQIIEIASSPGAFDGVPDSTLYPRFGRLKLFGNCGIEFLCDVLYKLVVSVGQDNRRPKIVIALDVGGNTQLVEEIAHPNLNVPGGLCGRGHSGRSRLCGGVFVGKTGRDGIKHFDHVLKGISLLIQYPEHLYCLVHFVSPFCFFYRNSPVTFIIALIPFCVKFLLNYKGV